MIKVFNTHHGQRLSKCINLRISLIGYLLCSRNYAIVLVNNIECVEKNTTIFIVSV